MLAPVLAPHDIGAELDRLFKSHRKSRLVAFFGTGQEQVVDTTHAGRFDIRPVRSELDLRKQMPPVHDDDTRIAFLVPWSTEIPVDLAARFIQNGRIYRIGLQTRLAGMFGVKEVDDDARSSPLANWLLATAPDQRFLCQGGRLTRSAMWSAWLSKAWNVDLQGGLALDALLAWAACDEHGPDFAAAMQGDAAQAVRTALFDTLRSVLGPSGPLVWQSWEAQRARAMLEHAVLFETLGDSDDPAIRMWLKSALRFRLKLEVAEPDVPVVVRQLGRAAAPALRMVERRTSAAQVQAIVRAADALVDEQEVRKALESHRLLPSAWKARLDLLGRVLGQGAQQPGAAAVERAVEALRALERHALFQNENQTYLVKRAEMAVRLLAWLSARPDRAREAPPTPFADVERLGGWFVEEGGYVDWARRWARGPADSDLGNGIQRVVELADQERTALDRSFALALQSWTTERRHAKQVLPIEHALHRIAVKFLSQQAERRLLVLLMDGMAWAQAVELLASLGERQSGWGPLAWYGNAKHRIGSSYYPVTIAALPTTTEVSRAAFFAGALLSPGTKGDTAKDADRFRDHRELRKLCQDPDLPRLLLRAEGHTKSGSVSEEALTLVGDTNRRAVGVVINAIDASLSADAQLRPTWTVESIASLPPLLDAARAAGRAVLLASDHGHVPADRFHQVGPFEQGGGARWRPWQDPSAPLHASELGFRGEGVWAPRGAQGAVLLADDASRYGASPHAGEHGGVTLAEVVAPCLLIGSSDLAEAAIDPDPGLRVHPPFVPTWWHYETRVAPPEPDAQPPPQPQRAKRATPQLTLPAVEAAPKKSTPPQAESPLAASELLDKLASSQVLRKKVLRAVDFLLAHNCAATEAAFANAMGVLPGRVGGVITVLQEVLNVEGYQVLRHATQERQVLLDKEKLAQQFEVTL